MKRVTFDSQSLQRRIMSQKLSLQTVWSHLNYLSNLIQVKGRFYVELNAAILMQLKLISKELAEQNPNI